VAVCGLYCGACEAYQAFNDNNIQKLEDLAIGFSKKSGKHISVDQVRCDGCLNHGHLTPWCSKCQIRLCDKLHSKKLRCYECDSFPCDQLSELRNDGMPHHVEVFENLRQIRKIGIEAWTKHEEERWACPECKTILTWYAAECPKCKIPRSKHLFPIPKG
jgi:hypothetical protein